MVHKRYVLKNGVLHGPYLYESYRDETGKVRKRYLGKADKFESGTSGMSREGFLLMFFLFFVMMFSFGMILRTLFKFIL